MKKCEKGIALITLVITIIIILIIAGIAIRATTSKNGILDRANEGSQTAQRESIIQKIEADIYTEEQKRGKKLNKEEIETEILKNFGTVDSSTKVLKTNDGNYEIQFSEIIGWNKAK